MIRGRRHGLAGRLASTAILVITLGGLAHAQSPTGTIGGVVTDPSGAALPGVTVAVVEASGGVRRTVSTDGSGAFEALLLPVGVYDVTARASGFEPRRFTAIPVTIGHRVMLRIDMTLAGVAESVRVRASTTAVDTTRTSAAATIDEHAIRNLPVNGRNFIDFVLLTPGVARDVRAGDLSFAGQRGTLNSLVVDGSDNNNTFAGQTLGRSGSGRAPYQFSVDAVKEFQINANAYLAEYGRAGAAVINVVTKSGGNEPRGSIFEYYRDKSLNATDAINAARGLPKAPYHYHQFGGTSGGPLRINRDFFFANYDGQRNTLPNTVFLDTASAPADAASLAAVERLRPLAFSWERRLDQHVFLIKTDHNLTPRHRVSLRYNHQQFTGAGYETGGSQNAWEHSGDSLVKTRTLTAIWPGQFGGRLFNELRVHYARDRQTGTANSTAPEAIIRQGVRPVLTIGRNFFSPRETLIDRAQVANTVAWMRGRHLMKAGVDLQFDTITNHFPGYFSGSYVFQSLADFDRGTASTYRQDFPGPGTSGPVTRPDVHEYSFFVQDEWRPNADFTVNAGMRYDLMKAAAPRVRNDHPELLGADIDTSRLNADTNNWAPRVGAAWTPRGGPAVLRAGGGLFYGRTPAIVPTAMNGNGIHIVSLTFSRPNVPTYPHTFATIPDGGERPPPTIFYIEEAYANPRLLHLNAAVEWEMFAGTTLTMTCLHVSGTDLPRSVDRNIGSPGQQTLTIEGSGETVSYHRFGSDRPFPSFGRVIAFESSARSRYNGLTVDFFRRVSRGLQVRAAYTLGKVVDTNPDATSVATDDIRFVSNPVDFNVDRTVGDNDRRHRLVASTVYSPAFDGGGTRLTRALASGWSLSAIFTAESGRPYSARMIDIDLNNDGNRLNDLAPGTRRNAFRLPAMVTLDSRVARELALRGRVRLHAIWEAFNLINRVNISGVRLARYGLQRSTLVPNAAFGEPIATAGERIMQLALRVTF